MARIDDLLPDVRSVAPGAPEFVITKAVQEAARDFCKRSGIWQETLPGVPLEAGEAVYEFEADGDVLGVIWGFCGDTRLAQRTDSDVAAAHHNGESGRPQSFAVTVDGQARVAPTPDADATGPLVFRAMLQPTRRARQLPDWLVDDWRDGLIHGASDRLMRQPGQAWTSYNEAQMARRFYDERVGEAKRQGMIGVGSSVKPTPSAIGSDL